MNQDNNNGNNTTSNQINNYSSNNNSFGINNGQSINKMNDLLKSQGYVNSSLNNQNTNNSSFDNTNYNYSVNNNNNNNNQMFNSQTYQANSFYQQKQNVKRKNNNKKKIIIGMLIILIVILCFVFVNNKDSLNNNKNSNGNNKISRSIKYSYEELFDNTLIKENICVHKDDKINILYLTYLERGTGKLSFDQDLNDNFDSRVEVTISDNYDKSWYFNKTDNEKINKVIFSDSELIEIDDSKSHLFHNGISLPYCRYIYEINGKLYIYESHCVNDINQSNNFFKSFRDSLTNTDKCMDKNEKIKGLAIMDEYYLKNLESVTFYSDFFVTYDSSFNFHIYIMHDKRSNLFSNSKKVNNLSFFWQYKNNKFDILVENNNNGQNVYMTVSSSESQNSYTIDDVIKSFNNIFTK